MARPIKCKDCHAPFDSVYELTKHKVSEHGYKIKRRRKKREEAPPEPITASQQEAQLMENVIGWFEESTLPLATHERIINYLQQRFAAPIGGA